MGISKTGIIALEAYSELLIKILINLIYLDPSTPGRRSVSKQRIFKRWAVASDEDLNKIKRARIGGRDWPSLAHSMIGYKRMRNLADCTLDVIQNNVEGDFIETGVWRGGACILMRGIANAANQEDRKVYVADSFEGLPAPSPDQYPQDSGDKHHTFHEHLAISLEQVKDNFDRYGLLNDNVVFLKGWFKDTLPKLEKEKFAVIRLDGDMYESTIQAIEALYPRLSKNGYIIVDDWGAVPACRKAIEDYRDRHNISDKIVEIDGIGVYWQKTTGLKAISR